MKINENNTKIMLFNQAIKYNFRPQIKLDYVELVEVSEQFKLLGVIVTSDLKWHMNTNHLTMKGFQRLWMLRRLKQLGAYQSELTYVYVKYVTLVFQYY